MMATWEGVVVNNVASGSGSWNNDLSWNAGAKPTSTTSAFFNILSNVDVGPIGGRTLDLTVSAQTSLYATQLNPITGLPIPIAGMITLGNGPGQRGRLSVVGQGLDLSSVNVTAIGGSLSQADNTVLTASSSQFVLSSALPSTSVGIAHIGSGATNGNILALFSLDDTSPLFTNAIELDGGKLRASKKSDILVMPIISPRTGNPISVSGTTIIGLNGIGQLALDDSYMMTHFIELGGSQSTDGTQNTVAVYNKSVLSVRDTSGILLPLRLQPLLWLDNGHLTVPALVTLHEFEVIDNSAISVGSEGTIEASNFLLNGTQGAPKTIDIAVDGRRSQVLIESVLRATNFKSINVTNGGVISANASNIVDGQIQIRGDFADLMLRGNQADALVFGSQGSGSTTISVMDSGVVDLINGGGVIEGTHGVMSGDSVVSIAQVEGVNNSFVTQGVGATITPGVNAGDIATLTIAGKLDASAGFTLDADIKKSNGVDTSDKLSVSGGAQIAGQLNLTKVAGSQSINAWQEGTAGDYFTVLSATGSLSGQFDARHGLNLPTAPTGEKWKVIYDVSDEYDQALADSDPNFAATDNTSAAQQASQPWIHNGTHDVVLLLEKTTETNIVLDHYYLTSGGGSGSAAQMSIDFHIVNPTYDPLNPPAFTPFSVNIYRVAHSPTVDLGQPPMTATVTNPAVISQSSDGTTTNYSFTFDVESFADSAADGDFRLLADVNTANAVVESAAHDNWAMFSGGAFRNGDVVEVQGTDNADNLSVTTTRDTTGKVTAFNVTFNGQTSTFAAIDSETGYTTLHKVIFHGHGGDDVSNVGVESVQYGGEGNNQLNGHDDSGLAGIDGYGGHYIGLVDGDNNVTVGGGINNIVAGAGNNSFTFLMAGHNTVQFNGTLSGETAETEDFSFGVNSFAYITAPDGTVLSASSVNGGLLQLAIDANGHVSIKSMDSGVKIDSVTLATGSGALAVNLAPANGVVSITSPDGSQWSLSATGNPVTVAFSMVGGHEVLTKTGAGTLVVSNASNLQSGTTFVNSLGDSEFNFDVATVGGSLVEQISSGAITLHGQNSEIIHVSNSGTDTNVVTSLGIENGNVVLTKSGTGQLNIDSVSGVTGALKVNFNDGALQIRPASGSLALKTPDNNIWTVSDTGGPSILALASVGGKLRLAKEGAGTLNINAGTQITAAVIFSNYAGNTVFNVDVGTPTSVVQNQIVDAVTPVSLDVEDGVVVFNCSVELQSVFIGDGAKVVLADTPEEIATSGAHELFTRFLKIANDGGTIYGTPNPTRTYSGTLDVRNNDIFVPYIAGETMVDNNPFTTAATAYNTIMDMVRSGAQSADGTHLWSGTGITSSIAGASMENMSLYALGVYDNGALWENGMGFGMGTDRQLFNGSDIPGRPAIAVFEHTVIVRFTFAGDANGDGTVNLDDYQYIDTTINSWATSRVMNDTNYDGIINLDDYQRIDVNISNPIANPGSSPAGDDPVELGPSIALSNPIHTLTFGAGTSALITAQDGSVWNVANNSGSTFQLKFEYDGTNMTITKSGNGWLEINAGTYVTSPVTFVNTAGRTLFNVDVGTPSSVDVNGNFVEAVTPVSVNVQGGRVYFNTAQELQSLNIAGNGNVTLKQGTIHSLTGGNNLFTRALTIAQASGTGLYLGTLNINGNSVVLDYGSGASESARSAVLNQLTAMIRSAADYDDSWGGLNWDGKGITSNTIGVWDPTVYSIAIADNAELLANGAGYGLGQAVNGKALYRGQAVSSHAILMRFTYAGDANQDGIVDAADQHFIDLNVNNSLGRTGYLWGDFNYDGVIDSNDQAYIDNNINNPFRTRLH